MDLDSNLTLEKIIFYKNFDTSQISKIKCGGKVSYFITPDSENKLIKAIKILKLFDIPYRVVGNFSNTIVGDCGFSGALISTSLLYGETIKESEIILQSGNVYPKIHKKLINVGLTVSPELSGIPGSVGGMIKSNAGAYGKCIGDFFKKSRVLFTDEMKIYNLSGKDMEFSYRSSFINDSMIILSASLRLSKGQPTDILSATSKYAFLRREKQPNEPSLGSVFKRSVNYPASQLIDECGLKGLKIGGAAVSEKHAGFIVNKNSCSANEFIALSKLVQDKIFEKYGIMLEYEINIIN